MKVFLFLYPYRRYFETCIGYPDYQPDLADLALGHYSKAIDLRYRQRGFRVCWLMFRSEGGGLEYEGVDQRVGIHSSDLLIDAGMTFNQHCPPELQVLGADRSKCPKPIYANLPYVFSQFPEPICELWIGGHRQQDCVDKVARFAYFKQMLKGRVHVDEDLTEMGMLAARYYYLPRTDPLERFNNFPLVRDVWSYESLGFSAEQCWQTDYLYKRLRRIRNLHPWLVHK